MSYAGGQDWNEDGGVRKMSGRRAGCCDPGSPTATDDPGLVSMRGKGCSRSHSAGFPRKRANVQACTGNEPDGTRGEGARAPRDSGDFHFVHPCRVNLFEKPCPRLWTILGSEGRTIE